MAQTDSLAVRVPGSSANLGSGFDVLGMAVGVYADLGVVHPGDPAVGASLVEGRHPALVAYRAAGGEGDIWVRSSIPSGRGLGFSGAMRVGAVALGLAQRGGVIGREFQHFIEESRNAILDLAANLEGHADNVAASLLGGVASCVERNGHHRAAKVPLSPRLVSDAHVVVWVPHVQTATSESRATLSPAVSRADAVFNLARLAQLLLGLGSGDPKALAEGVEDRIHQDQRLEKVPASRRALEAMREAGAAACWLSGSGPTVAGLVFTADLAAVESSLSIDALADAGRSMRLSIDFDGLQAAR